MIDIPLCMALNAFLLLFLLLFFVVIFFSSLLMTAFTLCIYPMVYGAYIDDYGYDAIHILIMDTG